MSENFHVKFSFSGPVLLEKKILKYLSYINTCKKSFPYGGGGGMILTNVFLYYVIKLARKF
jgi:hypothetical protein